MSLRTRLIIAFLILSVVPLGAMTLIWYVSSVHTFELVAQREANETAADIGRRMEMVKANVGRRMDRLFDDAVSYRAMAAKDPKAKNLKTTETAVEDRVAPMLGDTAALVERLEFHPMDNPDPNPNPNPNPTAGRRDFPWRAR